MNKWNLLLPGHAGKKIIRVMESHPLENSFVRIRASQLPQRRKFSRTAPLMGLAAGCKVSLLIVVAITLGPLGPRM